MMDIARINPVKRTKSSHRVKILESIEKNINLAHDLCL